MLAKLTGNFAPRASTGPHKLRECLPLIIFLRNRLKYALTYVETKKIMMQRLIKVDGKVRTDITYPAGFMDVISINKTGENFRLIYNVKGRFVVHRIGSEEAKVRFVIHPRLKDQGHLCMITGGRNLGRVGTITHREKHPGSFEIVHIKDASDHTYATRLGNVFVIGKANKAYVSLPKGKGIRLTIAEEREKRIAQRV
eukprot:XP_011674062.1 PREDICTED: 40S ribosomal protein S4 [Strongylocentrotus purpuratus]